MKQKFDGYAADYDSWFMENENLFRSEVRLYEKAIEPLRGKKVLSVGCGSGLFECFTDNRNFEGLEPSQDMAEIARKRGMKVMDGRMEDVKLKERAYDAIYFNGSSSYIPDLKKVYGIAKEALKEDGQLILFDVPKESAFGFMYLLGKSLDTFDHTYLEGAMPDCPYPLALAKAGIWHTTEEKIAALKALGFKNFRFYQTLLANPRYTNEAVEDVVEGYKKGGYICIIAEKERTLCS